MNATQTVTPAATWPERIWQDLLPTPGRFAATLRIVLSSVLTLILLLVLQMPFVNLALYFVFIVSRDSPAVSLRTGILSMVTLTFSVVAELGVIALTDNDPVARVLSVAVVTYLAGMLVVSTTAPTLGSTWGLIYCTLIALWERHLSADHLVKTSLFILGSIGITTVCSVFVEYLFGGRDPVHQLEEEKRVRYRALMNLFTLYAEGADPAKLHEAYVRVARLAAAGQAGMQRLYNTIVERNLDPIALHIGTRVRIPMLAQLMDLAAAFGTQNATADDPETRRRCAQIAADCAAILDNTDPPHGYRMPPSDAFLTLLDRIESVLHVIISMPHDSTPDRDKELVALPANKVPLFIQGAFKDKTTWQFGFKISLCATLCYILYFAVDWPGISTSVTTVLVAGLGTTGALKQKTAFRIVGALIGGLIFGLGSAIFLFPYMDTIFSLVLLVSAVVFISGWVSGGRQFSYVGLQIAFSFYLVAFEDTRAPTQLAPPRDRLIGILLALVVMWFVFDNLWPVRTVTAMRRALASILRNEADLFRAEVATPDHEMLIEQTDALRDHIGKTMAAVRSLHDAVEYEFGLDRKRHIETADQLVRAGLTSASLIWNELAVLHKPEDADFLKDKSLVELRTEIARELDVLEAAVLNENGNHDAAGAKLHFNVPASFSSTEILDHPRYGEYARNTIARYYELESLVAALESGA